MKAFLQLLPGSDYAALLQHERGSAPDEHCSQYIDSSFAHCVDCSHYIFYPVAHLRAFLAYVVVIVVI